MRKILIFNLLFWFFYVLFNIQMLYAGYFHYKLYDTPYILKIEDDAKLKELAIQDWEYYLYGVYKLPERYLSGWYLYLFPNKTFIVTKWCDICKEEIKDRGEWGVSENKIVFHSKLKAKKKHFLLLQNGNYKKLNFFVIGNLNKIKNSILIEDSDLPELNRKTDFNNYLERFIPYLNWEKDYLRLKNSEKK